MPPRKSKKAKTTATAHKAVVTRSESRNNAPGHRRRRGSKLEGLPKMPLDVIIEVKAVLYISVDELEPKEPS